MLKTLAGSIREYKKPTVLTLFFIMLEVVIEVLIPFMTANLINQIKAGTAMGDVVKTGILLIVMAILSLACGGGAGLTCSRASAGFAKNLRQDMFGRVQMYSFENIDKFSGASLVTRMTTDIANVQMAYMMIIRTAVRSPMMLVFSCVMAYIMGGKLAATFVVIIPVLAFGLILIGKYAMPAFRSVFRKYDKLNESIEENVRAMRVVKGFARENYEKEKFGIAAENIRKDFTKAERIVALNNPLMSLCMYFNMVFVLFIGSKIAISSGGQALDVGQISSMLVYGMQILMSLMMLSVIYVMVTISAESARRICEVLTEEPSLHNCDEPVSEVKDGSVEFENVSFKYSAHAENNALSDINLHIPSGCTVGIIGGTGSSKTSLIQLISRLYDVSEGTVRVGGIDVRQYDLETLRNQVSVVLQKNVLFSGTIRDNLRWGDPNATDEEIVRICKLAQAHEFIIAHPEGYDYMIDQGGTNVSGGQKQRLCIARALLKKPKILILDDSTSAVDTRTDALIRQAFRSEIPDTTKFIIAQRISSIQDADLIIVMDNGRIHGMGTHAEMLASDEIYREVFNSQNKAGGEE